MGKSTVGKSWSDDPRWSTARYPVALRPAGAGAGTPRPGGPEVNVTPLVDVVLVLLVIFLVVGPLLSRGTDVELPRAGHRDGSSGRGDLVLALTADGRLLWEDSPVGLDEVSARLGAVLADSPRRRIFLKADRSLSFGQTRPVLEALQRQGVTLLNLGTEP